ncbi:site-specific integrase [Halobacillus amylolyticus]|uniref:Core-binding (CB) domain-containing protein n=1 Tax=Halobacillus amylolyticus TaxID=2932259 RepID=A0ABY4H789_9BACI|nr:hypothetical protein [Halobacillus amylolyticus]UOR10657.1 hypothetical protein MUO15_13435 [Halobacillus amylolyticus]
MEDNLTLVGDAGVIHKCNKVEFQQKVLTIVEDEGLLRHFMFIVLRSNSSKSMKVTGYSNYFIKELNSASLDTLKYHAKIVVRFLNYIFFEKSNKYKIKDIKDLTIEYGNHFLRDYGQGVIGNKKKTESTVEKAEQVLNRFYRYIFNEIKGMSYIKERDFLINSNIYSTQQRKFRSKSYAATKSLFTIISSNYIPPQRIKHIPAYILQEILKTCDLHYYRHLKLAICLQAFGGLRRGEVCNVSRNSINYRVYGEKLGWFTVNLKEKVQLRTDGKDVGGIKRKRIQPVHPIFLDLFQDVYIQHMGLINNVKHPYGAVFLNRDGDAMLDSSYSSSFKKIMNLTLERLSKKADFKSSSEAKLLMSGRIGTHILRHFFTQFIAELETTRNPIEVAYWRGDSSLDSAISYYAQNPVIDEKIKFVQEKVFKDIL